MCDIRGIGLDLCAIPRMQELLDSGRRLQRIFTEDEEAYIRSKGTAAAQTMAGVWAAKEAVVKAIGVGLACPLNEVVIGHTASGQPTVTLTGSAGQYGGHFLLSISHEGDMAAAMVVWTA